MHSVDSFTDLARQAQTGEANAYKTLLKNLIPHIRKLIISDIRHPHTDDVIQEILVSVHKALHTYNPDRPFLPWVNAIIQFRKTDYLRQFYAQKQNMGVSLDDPDTPDYLVMTQAHGSTKDIEQALHSLPAGQQKVVELMKIKGYSAEEVSHKTGMSISAVKVSAHRALQKLKEKL
jgi:RNA polymerase sigma-70 factor (ECF subfamily)